MLKKKIIFLLGPTGIGKSKVAISLAKKLHTEIISCDSMQVYRRMDILTSKVTLAQQKNVKHHLLNIIDPAREYDVARYRRSALAICDQLFSRGKIPLFAGGTGLYYSVVVDGLFAGVSEDKAIRLRLQKQLKARGSGYLHRRLVKVDPVAAARIHAHDSKRVIRALEVYLKTGQRISDLQRQRVGLGAEYEIFPIALNASRASLYQAIDLRVKQMFKAGVVREVKSLLKSKPSRTAAAAIGVPEIRGYLKGQYGLLECQKLMQRNSRRYAKRQLTWLRKDKRIKWIKVKRKETSGAIASRIYRQLYK